MGKRWDKFWYGLNGKDPKPPKEFIDGWQLTIVGTPMVKHVTSIDFRDLHKIYIWYLTKDSPMYSINDRNGMYTVNRKDITGMSLTKTRLIKEYYI